MIKRDGIEAASGDVCQRFLAIRRMRYVKASPAERLLHKPDKCEIVVNIQDLDDGARHRLSGFRNLDDRKEQPELANCVCKALVVDRFDNVDVGTEIIATLDFATIVGSSKNHDR